MEFEELVTNEELLKAIKVKGYQNPTEIQEKAIPVIRSGRDIVARSQTGSGKTMAYVLPIIEKTIEDNLRGLQVLIICPTRELAGQVMDEIKSISKNIPVVKATIVCGGSDYRRQTKALKVANIVVGTPGRIIDHMNRGTIRLATLKVLVLDEADEMLNMGFKEDIELMLKETPKTRQTLLFSATFPPFIRKITKEYQNEAANIEVGEENKGLKNIKQTYIFAKQKNEAFMNFISTQSIYSAIVFCNTKAMTDKVCDELNKRKFDAALLHGDLKQNERRKVMQAMKQGKYTFLVATDVAARGIDINDIEYIINYDVPQNVEYYLHRIGRTARAGKQGNAITFVGTKAQIATLKDYARVTKSDISEVGFDGGVLVDKQVGFGGDDGLESKYKGKSYDKPRKQNGMGARGRNVNSKFGATNKKSDNGRRNFGDKRVSESRNGFGERKPNSRGGSGRKPHGDNREREVLKEFSGRGDAGRSFGARGKAYGDEFDDRKLDGRRSFGDRRGGDEQRTFGGRGYAGRNPTGDRKFAGKGSGDGRRNAGSKAGGDKRSSAKGYGSFKNNQMSYGEFSSGEFRGEDTREGFGDRALDRRFKTTRQNSKTKGSARGVKTLHQSKKPQKTKEVKTGNFKKAKK